MQTAQQSRAQTVNVILVYRSTNSQALPLGAAYNLLMDGPMPTRAIVLEGDRVITLSPSKLAEYYWQTL